METCVAESQGLCECVCEHGPSCAAELPGSTVDGLAVKADFSPPVAVKTRARAHPMRRTAGHKRQKIFARTAAFSGPLCTDRLLSAVFSRHGLSFVTQFNAYLGDKMNVLQQFVAGC